MDNYPDDLAPDFDEMGCVSTPFEEWWPRVSSSFPHVPEEVARDWLHRHWRNAPAFCWLPSADYRFTLTSWPSAELARIRINFNEFVDNHPAIIEQGEWLTEKSMSADGGSLLARYMVANSDFPVPPVILDNRDGHLHDKLDDGFYPAGYLLVEGHRRFEIASYLANAGRMKPTLDFWLMTHVRPRN